jgi:hypothetical protein
LFVWVYYAAQILFLGAEITQVYANEFGAGIRPKSDAVPLSDAARVEQGTKAPTDPNAEKTPLKPRQPKPVFSFTPRGPFNPLQLFLGAIGVRVFGWLRKLFAFAKPKEYRFR